MDALHIIVLPALYSFIASIAFGVQFNIRFRHIIAASVGGIISQVVFSAASVGGAGDALCYFLAASAVSAYSEILARRLHVPVNMYLIVGIIPLVPGGLIYSAMMAPLRGDSESFLSGCGEALGAAGAIAMGIFAVSSAARIIRPLMRKPEKR
jgi:uncharacterized membrane protein YjjB (DUF3815 family)